METSAEEPARSSWIRAVLLFVMHHAIAALAVLLLGSLVVCVFAGWAHLIGWTIASHQVGKILSGTPYFPVQVGLALFLGWSLGVTRAKRAPVAHEAAHAAGAVNVFQLNRSPNDDRLFLPVADCPLPTAFCFAPHPPSPASPR